ncbi:ArsR family transcriptional regulator [Nostoc minutum NIES-26]|uniref:ArsR family transcriptional regulator n=1 Tax=Nostoc minutum NIES-26 TaxID=1844469 RepID=A0A367R0V8_9NOSO|nr:ArsR family transcriptional regulator [Nostoc minutum NIES-26]
MMNSASKQIDCSQRLKVLADETRLAVLKLLMNGPKHVREIKAVLGLEQSLLSHHLQVLRQAKFVIAQRDGKAVLYHLASEVEVTTGNALNLGCCVLLFN